MPLFTITELRQQWENPSDVLSILLLIGGDIVQKALAQTTGGYITPTCFSFGWVTYSFLNVVTLAGDGRLLPQPDIDTKVINLGNGYQRQNRNWILGRLLRDHVTSMDRMQAPHTKDYGIRIGIYEACPPGSSKHFFRLDHVEIFWIVATAMQFALAAIPLGLHGDWRVFLITGAGTLAALATGMLPQWAAEKITTHQRSSKVIALTGGNGSRDVMIIKGCGDGLDLEALAAAESPRNERVWRSNRFLVNRKRQNTDYDVIMFRGLPLAYWATRVICLGLSFFWIALLITVAGIKSHTWFLLGVGGIGMLQNAFAAGAERRPDKQGLRIRLVHVICREKVMEGLKRLEIVEEYRGYGQNLLSEFFPGKLTEEEEAWWETVARYGLGLTSEKQKDNAQNEAVLGALPTHGKNPTKRGEIDSDFNARQELGLHDLSSFPRPLPNQATLEMGIPITPYGSPGAYAKPPDWA